MWIVSSVSTPGFDHSLLGSSKAISASEGRVEDRSTCSDSLCRGRWQPSTSGLTKRPPKLGR
jgi:hypothetical protein